MLKRISLLLLPFIIIGSLFGLLSSAGIANAIVGYNPGDVLITEFSARGEWVEIQNTTNNDIIFDANWYIHYSTGPATGAVIVLNGYTLPAKGILVFQSAYADGTANSIPNDGSQMIVAVDVNGVQNVLHGVAYGTQPGAVVAAPGVGETAQMNLDTQAWSVSSSISMGWFNNAVTYSCPAAASTTPPTLSSIASCLLSQENVSTNMSSTPNPSAADGLYFIKEGKGRMDLSATVNLTDQNVVTALRSIGDKLTLMSGSIGLDSQLAQDMGNVGASLEMYGLNGLGYNSAPNILARADGGAVLNPGDQGYPNMADAMYDTSGSYFFSTDHFTSYQAVPVIAEVTPVPTRTNTTTPNFIFSTNATGTYQFLGDCANTAAGTTKNFENNTVKLGVLAEGTHGNCQIQVIDGAGATGTLAMATFTVDITKPTVSGVVVSPNPAKAGTVTVSVNFSEPMNTDMTPNVEIGGIVGSWFITPQTSYTSGTWVGSFTLADNNEDTTSTVSVTAARDVAGNDMDNNFAAGTFQVDTVSPVINFTDDIAAGPSIGGESYSITVTDNHLSAPPFGLAFSADNICNASDTFSMSFSSGELLAESGYNHNGQYYCARATDTAGNTTYQISAFPLNVVDRPTITTQDATAITSTTVTFNGIVTAVNGADATRRGFYYSTSATLNPNTFLANTGSFSAGSYSIDENSLVPGTVYYFAAMASNTAGIATGTTRSFVTDFAPSSGNPTSTIDATYTATSTFNIPASLTNSVIDLSAVTAGNVATLPGAIEANVDTAMGTVEVSIPDGTVITADAAWNGILNLPTIAAASTVTVDPDSGSTATISQVIEVGFGDVKLTFDKAVRLFVPGQAGKDAGYYRDGAFTKITAVCSLDTQAWADANLGVGADCKMDSGADMVIWTKHFTKFISYSQTTNQTSTGGGGAATISQVAPILGANPVVVVEGATVAKRDVTLRFNATNAAFVAISESSSFSGASWQTYVNDKPYALSAGNGVKTLYVKFRATSGGETAAVIVNVTLTGQTFTSVTQPSVAVSTVEIIPSGVASNPDSKLMISKILATSYQPGTKLGYSYTYKNESEKSVKVKFTRQLLNSKGKSVMTYSFSKWLKPGAAHTGNVKDLIAKKTTPGEYAVKVKLYVDGKLTEENGFAVTVEKLKKKYFVLGQPAAADGALVFDAASLGKIKSDVVLPANLKAKYSYTNDTMATQTIKMVRTLRGVEGKVLSTKSGKWVMVPGEIDGTTFTQPVAGNLGIGAYVVKIQAQDWKTKEVLAENTLTFEVVLK